MTAECGELFFRPCPQRGVPDGCIMQSDLNASLDPQRVVSGGRDGAWGDSILPGVDIDDEIQGAVQQCGRDESDDLSVHVEITAPIKCGEDVSRAGLPEVISNAATQRSCLQQSACLHCCVPALRPEPAWGLPRSRAPPRARGAGVGVPAVSLAAASDTASTIP